jgi:hypothetical protein
LESEKKVPKGWSHYATKREEFEAYVDASEKHSGTACATLRALVEDPAPFGNLMQCASAETYAGKRLRMSAWVKSRIKDGRSQLWLRIDGDWKSAAGNPGCFDNMNDRPIIGSSEWTKYDLVVQLPPTSTNIAFGLMLFGNGQVWLDDVTFEEVSEDVPLTGSYTEGKPKSFSNLNFED